ncbi:DsbC family protein [Vogesella fluminis]|uniref:Thiol:disulfide interchange protein n=1 Tax=Vogesella fluminis TaxID=1069161 RepID=A0ABQ3H9M5_9NEIS|nr:DsbC family protein [Vogesella fluminis]GHD73266.1 protein disulfide-isomerase [Vogesella fluminis]
MNLPMRRLALAALMMPLLACSASAETPDQVRAAFKSKFPQHEVSSVQPAPVAGLFEVVVKMKQGARAQYSVVYTDATVDHLITGDLIDTKTRTSVTEERLAELNKVTVDWAKLPLDKAIKEVRGKGERKLVVFSDPDCPFCKKLERESLSQLDNVTVYNFLYPLAQLHPDAPRKARQIWCSSDRAASWLGFMRQGKALSGSDKCATPLAEIAALGERLGISGTPALIFPNGELVAGAIPLAEIERRLAAK